MTKLTVVTDRRGKLIGAVQGHELLRTTGEIQAEVSFEPGHKLRKLDVDIDLAEMTDSKELEKALARFIPKPARTRKAKGVRQKR